MAAAAGGGVTNAGHAQATRDRTWRGAQHTYTHTTTAAAHAHTNTQTLAFRSRNHKQHKGAARTHDTAWALSDGATRARPQNPPRSAPAAPLLRAAARSGCRCRACLRKRMQPTAARRQRVTGARAPSPHPRDREHSGSAQPGAPSTRPSLLPARSARRAGPPRTCCGHLDGPAHAPPLRSMTAQKERDGVFSGKGQHVVQDDIEDDFSSLK